MFSLTSSHRFLLYREPADMRKSFDALCGIVRSELKRERVGIAMGFIQSLYKVEADA